MIALGEGKSAKDLLALLLTVSDRHLGGEEPRDDVTVVLATRSYSPTVTGIRFSKGRFSPVIVTAAVFVTGS